MGLVRSALGETWVCWIILRLEPGVSTWWGSWFRLVPAYAKLRLKPYPAEEFQAEAGAVDGVGGTEKSAYVERQL